MKAVLPLLLTLTLCLGACSGSEHPATSEQTSKLLLPEATNLLTGQQLLQALRRGGYVIYFRHFHTDHSKWHEDPIKRDHATMTVEDFRNSGDRQRHLTEFGRRRAADVGKAIARLEVPIRKVLSSPYIRAVDSARLLAGREPDATPYELVYRGGKLTYEMMARNVRPLLGEKPAPGANTLIVSHRPQMDDIRFIEEGEAFVLQPLGDGKFNLVGTIYDSDWFEALVDPYYLGLRGQQTGSDSPPRGGGT